MMLEDSWDLHLVLISAPCPRRKSAISKWLLMTAQARPVENVLHSARPMASAPLEEPWGCRRRWRANDDGRGRPKQPCPTGRTSFARVQSPRSRLRLANRRAEARCAAAAHSV